jgi:hypothetical protein
MSSKTITPTLVFDREVERDSDPSGPRIRCPLCGWSPRKEDRWSCDCGHEWNTFDTGGVCPRLPSPVGFNPVPFVQSMVAAFGLVRAMTKFDLFRLTTSQSQGLVTSVQSQN